MNTQRRGRDSADKNTANDYLASYIGPILLQSLHTTLIYVYYNIIVAYCSSHRRRQS